MSERDDDDLESDDKLQGMRAVWLSMRDEEPSDKGLAALMAAAREKADELKEPKQGFWQKVLATLRRPPVLALASVTILLGGALFIAKRQDTVAVDERAAAPAPAAAPAQETAPAGSATAHSFSAGSASAGSASTGSSAPTGPATNEAPAWTTKAPTVAAPRPRPEREKQTGRKEERATVQQTESAAPPPPEPEAPKIATDQELPAAPVTRGAPVKPPATQPSPGGVVGGAGADTTMSGAETTSLDAKDSDEAERGRAQARVLQLVKQCESAAARGDCAAVKMLAAKIRSEDAATYKARVVKNSSIARCLE